MVRSCCVGSSPEHHDFNVQIRSRLCLKRSVWDGVLSSCLRKRAVTRQNFSPAATAKTNQGTSIQRGLLVTYLEQVA